jgi:hypothetical protein
MEGKYKVRMIGGFNRKGHTPKVGKKLFDRWKKERPFSVEAGKPG